MELSGKNLVRENFIVSFAFEAKMFSSILAASQFKWWRKVPERVGGKCQGISQCWRVLLY